MPPPLLYQLVVAPYSPRFCIYIVFDTKHVMLLILEVISYSTYSYDIALFKKYHAETTLKFTLESLISIIVMTI